MKHLARWAFCIFCLAALSWNTPAPLVYRAGEGWSYEPVGGGKWHKGRAKDQLEVAEKAFTEKDYNLCLKASKRVVKTWPLSDHAPRAQYLVGRAYEERDQDEKAFKEYQKLLEKYPKSETYEEVVDRQYIIANRYLAGKWFKLWGYIPFFPSMDKTVEMYEKLIKNGPYSKVAPEAQLNIGAAREKQSDYPAAVKAYERAADRYHFQEQVSAEAIYKAAKAYQKQAKTAEYDQSVAGQAISTYSDFVQLYPADKRVDEAQKTISELRTEQARGAFNIARFYEKKKRWEAAMVYYNEVLVKDPSSKYAEEAKQRIEILKQRTSDQASKK
ncbi:MAG: tetratricopeptide repeat protein [Verrucomicrobiales bacterium]